jgi:hypothetical protein
VKKLHELPIIFVNYTIGSGGWFLSSLIQKWINPSLDLIIDQKGSGHANTFIYHINNFYKDYMHSDIGLSVVNNSNLDEYSQEQRVNYLKNSIKINNPNNDAIVISLHCVDLDIFIKAFPEAKFICINITPEEIRRCRFNVLYKAVSARPELFDGMVAAHNKNLDECMSKLKTLNKENLEFFSWVDAEVIKFMPYRSYNSNNVINVDYDSYLNGDDIVFLDKIAEFLDLDIDQAQFDDAVASLITYRFSQPPLPQ